MGTLDGAAPDDAVARCFLVDLVGDWSRHLRFDLDPQPLRGAGNPPTDKEHLP